MRRLGACGCSPAHQGPCPSLHRRAVLVGAGALAGAMLARPALAAASEAPATADDQRFMRLAIEEARKADFPFGTVIVKDGAVVMRGRNLGRTTNDPTAHGEMVAIRRFVSVYPTADLAGTTLYTSGEPCPMCMSAILWSGIGRVVFAASIEQLATKIGQIMISSRAVAEATSFRTVQITGGVLAEDALALFK